MTPNPGTIVGMGVGAFAQVVREKWYLIVGLALLGAAIGLIAFNRAEPQYSAGSTVAISPITSEILATGSLAQQVNTATEATIMASNKVRNRAASSLDDGTTARDLGDALTVSIPSQSLALTATMTGRTPSEAAERANAMAEAYLDVRRDTAQAQIEKYEAAVSKQIERMEALRSDKSVTQAAVESELIALRRDLSKARTVVVNPGSVINVAAPPSQSTWPLLLPMLMTGLVLGVLAGLATAFLMRSSRGRVRTLGDIQQAIPGRIVDMAGYDRIDVTELGSEPIVQEDTVTSSLTALAVQLRTTATQGPIVVLSDAQLKRTAEALCRAADSLVEQEAGSQAFRLVPEDAGAAAIASSHASALVITAAAGLTLKKDLRSLIQVPVRVLPPASVIMVLLVTPVRDEKHHGRDRVPTA